MTDTANRLLWTVIGFLLLAVGAYGIVAHFGRIPGLPADTALLSPRLLELWRSGEPWIGYVVVAVGVLLVLVGLWLFGRQFRRRGAPSIPDLRLRERSAGGGTTVVRAGGLVRALERDLARATGVTGADAVLTGQAPRPDAWLRLDLAPEGSVDRLREHVNGCLERFETTSGMHPVTVDVTVRPSAAPPSRVN